MCAAVIEQSLLANPRSFFNGEITLYGKSKGKKEASCTLLVAHQYTRTGNRRWGKSFQVSSSSGTVATGRIIPGCFPPIVR